MTTVESVFLGVLQGATEFLPVSSSGHLLLAQFFLKTEGGGLTYDVILHLGTLLAVLAYFRNDWLQIILGIFTSKAPEARRLFLYIVAGTIPGVLAGYFLEDLISTHLRSPWVVVCTLSGVALLMAAAEKFSTRSKKFHEMRLPYAMAIGIAQATAIIPGVSRSGITMTTGLLCGFSREAAARFSFLLSAPIIAGAGLYEGLKLFEQGAGQVTLNYLWGFLASALSGYLVIAFLMNFLKKHTFYPFVWYRLALAAVVAIILVYQG